MGTRKWDDENSYTYSRRPVELKYFEIFLPFNLQNFVIERRKVIEYKVIIIAVNNVQLFP